MQAVWGEPVLMTTGLDLQIFHGFPFGFMFAELQLIACANKPKQLSECTRKTLWKDEDIMNAKKKKKKIMIFSESSEIYLTKVTKLFNYVFIILNLRYKIFTEESIC